MILPMAPQVRCHAVILLSPAISQPESGHNLIKDQQDTILHCKLTQTREKTGRRGDYPLQRFHDDCPQFLVVRPDDG